MRKLLGLSTTNHSTQHALLAAFRALLPQQDCFAPLREHVQLDCKTVVHTRHEKLLDVVVSMLEDCPSHKRINTRLRPNTALARGVGTRAVCRPVDNHPATGCLYAAGGGAVADCRRADPPA